MTSAEVLHFLRSAILETDASKPNEIAPRKQKRRPLLIALLKPPFRVSAAG
jgi:hypothetical protein